jgi:ABC-type Fe3+/spermidine/putrescine transport system ATPase subunit
MNLFPGRVVGAGNAGLRLEAAGLGSFELTRKGAPRGDISIAIRPEKVGLSREAPGDGLIAAHGRVAQIAYFGDASHVYVETDAGLRIACNRPNQTRTDETPLAVGDPCWVAWRPADCILLAE